MIPLSFLSQRIFVVAAISATATVAGRLLLYQGYLPVARAFGSGSPTTNSANVVYLAPNAAATSTVPKDPVREVHIANTGLTLLRGARVLSVSGSTIIVGMPWGASEFTWTVETSYSTKFFNAQGEKGSLANIHAGDIVTVTGTISQGGAKTSINATIVRQSE